MKTQNGNNAEYEKQLFAEHYLKERLRSAGCSCRNPNITWVVHLGPRCPRCSVTVNLTKQLRDLRAALRRELNDKWD